MTGEAEIETKLELDAIIHHYSVLQFRLYK